MKKSNLWKRVLSIALAGVLAVGAMSQGTTAEVKNKAFANKSCGVLTKSHQQYDGSYVVEPWFDVPSCGYIYNKKNKLVGWTVKQGKTINTSLWLPPKSTVKSISIKSNNKKVIKVVDKRKGTFKVVKRGTAVISYKVVWNYTGKVQKYKNKTDSKSYGKITKKGNTYTAVASMKLKVICKSHKYGTWVTTKEASCESEGEQQRKCSVCGEVQKKMIEATDHQYDSTTHKCTVCGEYDEDYEE